MIPVVATDAGGLPVADLKRDEFTVFENDVKQPIVFFGQEDAPIQVILMLDTSASSEGKLAQIQAAAIAFIDQLKPLDRVKVISFDDEVRELNDFTSDRKVLQAAVMKTRSGQGTKLYDAMETAFSRLRNTNGRKAIVLFTDGVDYRSTGATLDGTLYGLDQEGVIVYPIRFDTRAEAEKIARQTSGDTLPTIGVIRTNPPGTTAPTFPTDNPENVSTGGVRSGTILGLPSPDEIRRRTQRNDPNYPREPRNPSDPTSPDQQRPKPTPTPSERKQDPKRDPVPKDTRGNTVPGPFPDPLDPRVGMPPRGRRAPTTNDDSVTGLLDAMYGTADSYLEKLATKSGGRLLRADTVASLPDAFSRIATELRTQYSIGYDRINKARDGQYRNVKVLVSRKGILLRSRPGYRAQAN
jgi:hypothetical protein